MYTYIYIYIYINITRELFPRFFLQERSLAGGTVADFNIGLCMHIGIYGYIDTSNCIDMYIYRCIHIHMHMHIPIFNPNYVGVCLQERSLAGGTVADFNIGMPRTARRWRLRLAQVCPCTP